jgi:type IV/VI secretion system ImpK/VasF family protein
MNIKLWQRLVAANRESSELVAATIPEAAADDLDNIRPHLGKEVLARLHEELRALLARLSTDLSTLVEEADNKEIIFLLTLRFDERVQRRLSPDEENQWPLLQRALFQIHDGGDVFYDLIDERLKQRDTSPRLIELCLYCLSDGFVGRHARNKQKLEEYKRKLAGRLERTTPEEAEERTTAWVAPRQDMTLPPRYYLYATAAALGVPALLVLLW